MKKRIFAVLIAIAMLFAVMPLAANAAGAEKIAEDINDFAFYGSGALTADASGNTVTVTGTATSGGRVLDMNFDPGVTVIWKADYTSSESSAISVNGEGVFELPAGGVITHKGSGNAIEVANSAVMTVNISGGEIRSENGGGIGCGTKGALVNVNGGLVESKKNAISGQQAKIHISGGLVTSSEGVAISNISDGASVTVSGGEVRSVDSVAIGSIDVTISGGLVENSDTGHQTISAKDSFTMTGGEVRNPSVVLNAGTPGGGSPLLLSGHCIVDISGGQLSARIGSAIYNYGEVNVRGGFVFAYGKLIFPSGFTPIEEYVLGLGGDYPTALSGVAVVCAWNQAAGHAAYTAGTSDDLVAEPEGASAVWGIEGGKSGIKYANGANTGFFALGEVTVSASGSEPAATPTPTPTPAATPEPTPTPVATPEATPTSATTPAPAATPTPAPAQTATPAPAVQIGTIWSNANDWAVPELEKAASLGLIPDSLYGMDFTRPITRAEFAAVSVKVYENLSGWAATPAAANPFTDTSDTEVLKAFNVGITAGTSTTTFEPNLILNREQAATMLTRVYKRIALNGWTLATDANFTLPYTRQAPFADDADISDWAKDSVYFMVSKGVIQGMGNNLFAPRNITSAEEATNYASATREQALLISTRMVENLR